MTMRALQAGLLHPSRFLRPGLVAFLFAASMCVTGPAAAQAAGASMDLKLVESGFVDNDHSGDLTLGDQVNFTTTATNNSPSGVTLTNVHVFDKFNPTGTLCPSVPVNATCISTSSHTIAPADVAAGQITDNATAISGSLKQTAGTGSSVTNVAELAIVSGNDQIVSVGKRSEPLTVELTNNNVPVAHAVITWTTSQGTLASATSMTDATGKATNTVILRHAGTATVTATSVAYDVGPITFVLNGGLTRLPGLTQNEMEVASSLDHACPALARMATLTAAQQDLLAQCEAVSAVADTNPGHVGDLLDQLAPTDALLQTSASILTSTAQFDNVKARLAALRSGTGGDHFGGLAFETPDGVLPVGGLGDALLGFDGKQGDQKQEAGAGFERWGFFASGDFSHGSADPRSVTPGYGFHTNGVTAGIDYRYSDHLVLGVSAGYNNYSSSVDVVGGGMTTHGWSLSAYSTFFKQDDWYVDSVLTWSSNDYDIDRRIVYTVDSGTVNESVNQEATSHSSGNTFSGAVTLGRDFAHGPWSYGPYVREMGTRTDFGGYQENLLAGQPGSGLGLVVQGRRSVSLQGVLGAKLNYAASTSWGVLMPHAEVEWIHEFKDNPDIVNASFLQDPTATPFQLTGDALDQDFFKLGIGLSGVFQHGISGFLYGERTLGLSGVTQSEIAIGIRMEF